MSGTPGVLVCDGGSNMSGRRVDFGMAERLDALVTTPHTFLNASLLHEYRKSNVSLTKMLNDAATDLDPSYDPTAPYNLLLVDVPTGDVTTENYAQTTTYIADRQAVGWTVCLLTGRPVDGSQDHVDAFNAWVLAGTGGNDGVVDCSADLYIGVEGAQAAHPECWLDASHVNDLGSELTAWLMYYAILAPRLTVSSAPIPTEQLDRVLVGSAATLSCAPTEDDGEAVPLPTGATATLTIADGAGTVLTVLPLEVTLPSGPEEGEPPPDLEMSCVVPSATIPLLDSYLLTWTLIVAGEGEPLITGWTTTLEVVGGFHCTVAAFRALRGEFATIGAAQIRDARTLAEMRFEDECKVAFVPRGAREQLRGDGTDVLLLGHVALREIYAVVVSDGGSATTWTEAQIAALRRDEGGIVACPDSVWPTDATIDIHYAHGYDRAGRPVRDAALTLMREYAIPDSHLPSRAFLQLTEYGNFRVSGPDKDHPFGNDTVDAVYRDKRRLRPAIG